MDVTSLTSLLAGLPVKQIRYFDTIGSSNDEALAWLQAGAQDGCLVVADHQTRGRGRLNRRWITQPAAALAFSLILRPAQEEIDRAGFFSPLGALAICQALEGLPGLRPQIKWPNDVLIQQRKVAGILVETSWLQNSIQGVVIGIGINVKPEAVPLAGDLLFPATSVEESAGAAIDRATLLREILRALFVWRSKIHTVDFRRAWEQRLAFRGQWVQIEGGTGTPVTGQVLGIDALGSLLVRSAAGATIPVSVGDVHLRPRQMPEVIT
jgi:BirA family biotin operon repressor/biotin-[acetyl-CoA-carboxylase] ligase